MMERRRYPQTDEGPLVNYLKVESSFGMAKRKAPNIITLSNVTSLLHYPQPRRGTTVLLSRMISNLSIYTDIVGLP